ncbi:MAG: phage/plasmid primase, P4 family [Ruminococcus sp.]|nr:phage/plasmid primase, P4 family [Ruminococcus sp.]
MTIKKINEMLKLIHKIKIEDLDNAADEIVNGVVNRRILFFDNRNPIIRFPLFYQRAKVDDAEALIFNLLDAKSQMTVQNKHIKEAIKRLCYMPKLQIDLSEEFWKNQMLVNLAHGVYDIQKQEIIPKSESDIFDYFINIRYIPKCTLDDAPVFKKYVESSVGMEQFDCLMRVLGYCISSLTKGRKAFVFYGVGRTGKSTILNVLESVMGGGLVSHEPFHTMSGERAKAHYEGKRVNISRETSTKPNRNEESFKSLISCEFTTGSEKFEKQRDFVATLSFVFAGNTDVDFTFMDDAILDRLVYLIFNRSIPEEDIDLELESKLIAEKDVIFSMALDSLKGLIEDKYNFRMSALAEEHIRHRRFLIHSAESFIKEKCFLSEGGKVSKVALFDAYTDFCKANALKPDGRNTFYDKVRNFSSSITDGRAPDNAGNSVQGFHGISLAFLKDKGSDE